MFRTIYKIEKERMPADNKRFGEIGGEVIIQISVVSFNRRC